MTNQSEKTEAGTLDESPARSFEEEFATVDLVMNSGNATSYVDAFSLAYIKAERQMRRLFTCVVFQASCFEPGEGKPLREVLSDERVYFEDFQKGLNLLLGVSVQEMVGEEYGALWLKIKKSKAARNKIFHGQLTNQNLNETDLKNLTEGIRSWCKLLSAGAQKQIGYDGFGRNSFRKLGNGKLSKLVDKRIPSRDNYPTFLDEL